MTDTISSRYDAVVVGASIAGSTTAMLLARGGARVALIDRQPDPIAYKRICGHFIQSSAVPMLERTGLLDPIERAGAVRSRMRIWTRWGWIEPSSEPLVPPCLNLRRERLDPLLRAIAADTPGVELMLGSTVERVLFDGGRATGVEARDRTGRRTTLQGTLIIGADGRDSRVAELAGLDPDLKPHGRFSYAGYFEGPPPAGAPNSTVWFLDPQWAAAFPTDAGLTMYACFLTGDRLPEFRRDPTTALRSFIADLPEAPPIAQSRLVGPVSGKLRMPNVRRGPVAPGLALVGDAALASDPVYGVGCGWALESAEWLAEETTAAVLGEAPLEKALHSYRERFRHRLLPHDAVISGYSTGRPLNLGERMTFSAATRDEWLAGRFEAFGTRNVAPSRFIASTFPRVLAVQARHRLALIGSRSAQSHDLQPAA